MKVVVQFNLPEVIHQTAGRPGVFSASPFFYPASSGVEIKALDQRLQLGVLHQGLVRTELHHDLVHHCRNVIQQNADPLGVISSLRKDKIRTQEGMTIEILEAQSRDMPESP